ncbi:hypothetical protein GJ744_005639 [Endocarpon pusillum]|uniref:Uncharacterized protein n=1 Tax=Endocarpon pusillum TaxID=364733 RepID=A0A8H7A4M3_9EURO|nr:hypothetical protein GJ744_005639 [Endocarpon pusillum]
MLRMRPEEWLSAGACLTKRCNLGLFDAQFPNSGSATPTQQAALQSEISDDDGSTAILIDALWDTEEELSNHDENTRVGVQESRNLRVSSSPSNGDGHGSKLGSSGTVLDHLVSKVPSPADLSCPPEARSMHLGEYKRQRSPAVGSANDSSGKGRVKRRPPDVCPSEVPVSQRS